MTAASIRPVWIDLAHLLRWPALALLLATLCWGGATAGSYYLAVQQHDLQQQLTTLRTSLQTQTATHSRLQDEQRLMHILQKDGLLQRQEDRMAWLHGLMLIQQDHPQIRYRIEAQHPFPGAGQAGRRTLLLTPLNLQLPTRHEPAFSVLHQRVQSLPDKPLPLRWQLKRTDHGLEADCDYGWIMFDMPIDPGERLP